MKKWHQKLLIISSNFFQYCQLAQNQHKIQFLFHKNCSPCGLGIYNDYALSNSKLEFYVQLTLHLPEPAELTLHLPGTAEKKKKSLRNRRPRIKTIMDTFEKSRIRALASEREDIQKKTFTKWINSYLIRKVSN